MSYDSTGKQTGATFYFNCLYGDATKYTHTSYLYYYLPNGAISRTAIALHSVPYSKEIEYTYDTYNRLSGKVFTAGSFTLNAQYGYNTHGTNSEYTSAQISSYTSTVNGTATTYTYTYDYNNNITKIVYSTGEEIRYVYDDLNQLIREDNGLLNKTYSLNIDIF